MTVAAAINEARTARESAGSYQYAHWYFLAALTATIAGFWPSFFSHLRAVDMWHSLHGVTATLWIVALSVQSWLMSRGYVTWHRRVAMGALVVLPILVASALYMVGLMVTNPKAPPAFRQLLPVIDLLSITFLVVLVTLALRNVRTPAAHKRFMSATVLLGLPPALTRLYARVLFPQIDPRLAFQASLFTVELILVMLIAADRRAGERRLAYPLSLMFFAAVHVLMGPISSSGAWQAAMAWYASLPVFS